MASNALDSLYEDLVPLIFLSLVADEHFSISEQLLLLL